MMRKLLILASALLAVFSSCSRQEEMPGNAEMEESAVSVRLTLPDVPTRASFDGDGKGALVDRWVVEVRDCSHPDRIFYRKVKDAAAGVHEQTFDLMLVRNQTYDIAFWADTRGCYDIDSLSSVAVLSQSGNEDKFDAFCCCLDSYTCTGNDALSAVLTRPLAQVNFIATDLKRLEENTNPDAYAMYQPENFAFSLRAATHYNVFSGTVVPESIAERVIKAPGIYGTFSPAAEKTTLFMGYVFTDNDELKDVNLKFVSNGHNFNIDVSNVPLKKNYRTNIFADYMVGKIKCTVTVNPDWNEPEQEVIL